MLTLRKEKGRDFLILNLTDTHLSEAEWPRAMKSGAFWRGRSVP